jgi:hypothetical protein
MKAVLFSHCVQRRSYNYLLRSAFFFHMQGKKKKKPGEGELMHFIWTYMKKG